MRKLIGFALLIAGASLQCMAGLATVPEVDPASGGAAVALITGGLLVLRARRNHSCA